jgi:hypothetical protein
MIPGVGSGIPRFRRQKAHNFHPQMALRDAATVRAGRRAMIATVGCPGKAAGSAPRVERVVPSTARANGAGLPETRKRSKLANNPAAIW